MTLFLDALLNSVTRKFVTLETMKVEEFASKCVFYVMNWVYLCIKYFTFFTEDFIGYRDC
jgi:hypothetical protein